MRIKQEAILLNLIDRANTFFNVLVLA